MPEKLTTGYASVKNGKWHATTNPEPSWYPRDNEEATLCGLSINPVNVAFAGGSHRDLNGGSVCESCIKRL